MDREMDRDQANAAVPRPLAGRVIALPETRELDRLAQLLEAEGATAWRCPLVAILDVPDAAPVEAWLRELAAGRFDDVVFLTGEGVRRLMAVAGRLGIAPAVVGALGRARKITRGPKPARALKEMGLGPDIAAAIPTSRGVMTELGALDLRGRRVGVQLYGEEPNHELRAFITAAGAEACPVAPYVYAPATDGAKVVELIEDMAAGRVDAIAFTSASQVDRLVDVARTRQLESTLAGAWARVRVAAIGPIAAEALRRHGIEPAILPQKAFVMKRLVTAIVDSLGQRGAAVPDENTR
ncbi:MAG: uroporphyrinogen-III synthase [Pseudomonadota bacterium]